MKIRILVPSVILILLIACNSSKHKENNNSLVADTITKFEPSKYQEETKDTLLDADNNFRVIIKKASRMDKFITKVIEIDSTHIEKLNYRDNSINIKVQIGEIVKFDTTLYKENLQAIGDEDFLQQSIMWGARIESYNKESQTVLMSFNVLVPDTDWSYDFSLEVDKDGKSKLLLEEIE